MYTDKRNILQLASLLKAHNVKKIVLCPGIRNLPLTQTLANVPEFTCYPMTDERSAGFFALGLALHDGTPAAICCESGAATQCLHAVVSEAYRQKVQVVIISAGKDRLLLPTKKSVTLPEVKTEEDEQLCNRLINEALLELNHHGKGPVHINLCVNEPFLLLPVSDLPEVRVIRRYRGLSIYDQDYKPLIERLNRYQRRMVVVGQMNLIYLFDKRYTKLLYKQFAWIAENIGNRTIPGQPIKNIDPLLTSMNREEQEKMRPDLLITYGGRIVSDRLKRFLTKHPPTEHWHISPDGEAEDTFGALTTIVEMDPFEFLEKIANMIDSRTPDYPRQWETRAKSVPQAEFKWSEMSVIGNVISSLPPASTLLMANGSAVRYSQFFDVPRDVEVISCCGTGGADGTLAAALGYASVSTNLNFIVLGDLSFLCGMNALWSKNYGSNVRILLLNNGGGEIFHAQPGLAIDEGALPYVAGSHTRNAKSLAEDCGFIYLSASNEAELQSCLPQFVSMATGGKPVMLEAFTDATEDIEILKSYFRELKNPIY